jgi:hypothetical protein
MIKTIREVCPTCKKTIKFAIDTEKITGKTNKFPISVAIRHEDHDLIVYIDANYKVRGIEPIFENLITCEKDRNCFELAMDERTKKVTIKGTLRNKVIFLE